MTITIQEAITRGTQVLRDAGIPNPRMDAQILLSAVSGLDRAQILTYPERQLTGEQQQGYEVFIQRRSHNEPVAYIVGHKEFYGLDFVVDRRVLIPRPETELLVECALRSIRERLEHGEIPVVADIGTGSGAIPITLAVEEPRLPYLYACDISQDALEVTRINCARHGVSERVRLLHGNLIEPLPEAVDILLANLPYVGTDEISGMSSDVLTYEPHLALFSGPLGLDLLYQLCQNACQSGTLRDRGVILLEIGYQQSEPLTRLLRDLWPAATITSHKDYAGWDRLIQVTL